MKNKKNIYIIVLSLSIFTIISSVLSGYFKNNEIKKQTEINSIPVEVINKTQSLNTKEVLTNENVKNVSISLNILDKSYSVKAEEGVNVYDVMKNIKDKDFSFKAIEHPGLGYFIEEINGIKGSPGKYWIYYVNDKEASVGVSNYILKDGDIISWKQE